VKLTVGGLKTVIDCEKVSLVVPSDTTSVIVYTPGLRYSVDGFVWVDVFPLPKSQCLLVIGPVEALVMSTTKGAQPFITLHEKEELTVAKEVRV
jgi:hypothetical protein